MANRILVLRGEGATSTDWDLVEGSFTESSYEELSAEFCFAMNHSRNEVNLVVFERSVPMATFVDFLSRPKKDFRGDVLFVGDADIFLSAMLAGDGRVLYRLSNVDLQFYLSVKLGREASVSELLELPELWHMGRNNPPQSPVLTFE